MSSNSSMALSKPLPTAMLGGQNQVQNEPSNIVPKDSLMLIWITKISKVILLPLPKSFVASTEI